MAYRKVILGPVSWALLAFAAGIAAPFVALDEGAAENQGLESSQLFDQGLAPTEQSGSGVAHEPTSYITGPSVSCRLASSIFFPDELNQFAQLDQTGRMQDGCLLKHAGVRRRWSLISPLARQRDRAVVLVEKREHFVATYSADLENKKPFSQQRVKRVSYGRPSQMVLGMECSLLGVSPRFETALLKRPCAACFIRSSSRCFTMRPSAFAPDATATRPWNRR